MGRKKGTKNADTDLKARQALEGVLSGKTRQMVADELGINRNTITDRLKRAVSNSDIQSMIQRSIDRGAMMLGKADFGLNEILDDRDPTRQPTRLRAVEGLYKAYGVWKEQPVIQINNFTPIIVKTTEGIETIDVGAPSETGAGVQEPE